MADRGVGSTEPPGAAGADLGGVGVALTGVLLVGGVSRRFGSPKALATFEGETLAERGWRLLGRACDERLAFGRLELPFPVYPDADDSAAPIAGVVAALRRATNDVCVVLPVDCPHMTEQVVRQLGEACRDAAVSASGPLPGAWARSALPVLERRLAAGRLSLREAYPELDVVTVAVDERFLADADTPAELARLAAAGRPYLAPAADRPPPRN